MLICIFLHVNCQYAVGCKLLRTIILFSSVVDHNRVRLSVMPGELGSDYINASFIDVSDRWLLFICGRFHSFTLSTY